MESKQKAAPKDCFSLLTILKLAVRIADSDNNNSFAFFIYTVNYRIILNEELSVAFVRICLPGHEVHGS
jgi:hypothetical protein